MDARDFYLAAYDISSNKRRAKIAKVMESMGARVQGSVFEIWLNKAELETLMKRVKRVLNEQEDSVRIYSVCQNCQAKLKILGQGKKTAAPELVIV